MAKPPKKPEHESGPSDEEPAPLQQRSIVDVLSLDEYERQVVQYLLRVGGADAGEIAMQIGQSEGKVRLLLDALTKVGYIQPYVVADRTLWRTRLSQKPHRPSSIWNQLDKPPRED